MSFRPTTLTALAAAVLAALSAHAQTVTSLPVSPDQPAITAQRSTQASETAQPIQKVEIKGSSAAYDPRRDDTASKIVVSDEEIRRYGDTSITDVFKRVPGVTVGGAAGRGGGEIRMRGLGNGYTQILLNGERAPAGFSIDTLSPDVIERIEIVRAASAEFSTQSIAGTINIVLKRAVKTAQRELKVSAAKSADQNNPSASLQMSDKDGALSYSLGANVWRGTYERESPVRETLVDPDGVLRMARSTRQQDSGRWEGLNLSPRLNWNLEGGDTLTSQTFLNANRNLYHGYQDIATELGARPLYDARDMYNRNHNVFVRTDLNWVHRIGEARLDAKAGVSGMRAAGTWREYDYRGGTLGRDATVLSETTEKGLSTQGKYATPLVADHALSMGWDAGVTTRDDGRRQDEADLPGRIAEDTDEGYEARITRLALFAQDEWNITPRWSMYAGLRWEGLETVSEGSTFATVRQTNSVWSPLAQTLYKLPDSRDQVRLALTRTYKAPPAGNLVPRRFTSTNNSQTEPDRRGNPDLEPELASGVDASYEHYWGENALLSAAASMRRISGYTRQGLFLEDGRWVATPVNDGNAVTRSIELEAKFPLSAVMQDAPGVDLRASLARNWSKVDTVPGPDNRLDQQTPLSATLGADYRSRDGRLTTGASFAFRDGGPVRSDTNQTSYQSVRRDLDVYALWKFNPQYQLRVAVSNLLGQEGVSDSAYLDNQGTLRRTSMYPGYAQGRATLEMRF
jgi:outer membrane receptor for ferrienterochelin and colicins